VDAEAGLRVLVGGLAGNRIIDRKGASMLARDFTPGFRVDLHHKDLGIAMAAAREAGAAVPLGAHAAQLMAALRAQGDGSLDDTALLKLVERLSGRRRDRRHVVMAPAGCPIPAPLSWPPARGLPVVATTGAVGLLVARRRVVNRTEPCPAWLWVEGGWAGAARRG